MVVPLSYWLIGETDACSIIVEVWTTLDLLKGAIKAKHLQSIPWDASKLQLFLAKTTEGSWLTVNDMMTGAIDTSGMKELTGGTLPLRALGLSEGSMRVDLSDEDLVAGKGPVHVLVKVPSVQQPQPSLTQPRAVPQLQWKTADETVFSLQNEKLYFVDREQAVNQLCAVHKSVFIGASSNP